MKKVFFSICTAAFLTACGGGDETSETKVNSNGPSSVVENVNPEDDGTVSNTENKAENTEESDGGITSIEYFEKRHDFGKVFYPSDNKYTFKFKNTGSAPLVIDKAKASCGCTIPNKPEEPIMPGDIGELDVIFRPKSGQVGQQVTKKITVTANTSPKETYLEITAFVMEAM